MLAWDSKVLVHFIIGCGGHAHVRACSIDVCDCTHCAQVLYSPQSLIMLTMKLSTFFEEISVDFFC